MNSFVKYLSFCLVTLFSSHVLAVKLIIPEEFVVERLNGEEFMPSLFTSETVLDVSSGQNVLVLKYAQMFEDDMEDHHTTIRSNPFILIFSVGKEQRIEVQFPEQLDTNSASDFAKKPKVVLVDENGTSLAVMNQSLSQFNDQVMKQSLTKQQALINAKTINNASTDAGAFAQKNDQPSVDNATSPKNGAGPNNIDMLKYWWLKASASEKAAFLQFTQENKK